jgi:hypothetical protein
MHAKLAEAERLLKLVLIFGRESPMHSFPLIGRISKIG